VPQSNDRHPHQVENITPSKAFLNTLRMNQQLLVSILEQHVYSLAPGPKASSSAYRQCTTSGFPLPRQLTKWFADLLESAGMSRNAAVSEGTPYLTPPAGRMLPRRVQRYGRPP
jgi:hypothetical protein